MYKHEYKSTSCLISILHINNFSDEEEWSRSVVLLIWMTICLGELLIYVQIYWSLNKNDQKMVKSKHITKEAFNQRRHKNIITLRGQITLFVFELGLGIVAGLSLRGTLSAGFFAVAISVFSTLSGVAQLWCSHELRRYLYREWENFSF